MDPIEFLDSLKVKAHNQTLIAAIPLESIYYLESLIRADRIKIMLNMIPEDDCPKFKGTAIDRIVKASKEYDNEGHDLMTHLKPPPY